MISLVLLLVLSLSSTCRSMQATNSASSGCPYEHELKRLDWRPTVSACQTSGSGECCKHIGALVGVAASQYTNSTGLLFLPKHLGSPCLGLVLDAVDTAGVPPAVSRSCGLRLGGRCGNARTAGDVRQTEGFGKVVAACSSDCGRCPNVVRRFAEDSGSCRDAVFLAVASLGDANYALDKANCMLNLPKQQQHAEASGCPLGLNSWQVQNVVNACGSESAASCCSLSLLTLRIAAAKAAKTSGQLFIPAKQAVTCIDELGERVRGQKASAESYAKCGLSPRSIFNDAKRGCNRISTFAELEQTLARRGTNWSRIVATCSSQQSSCGECRRAALDAGYAAAWPYFDSATMQSCMDLVFLMLAASSPTTKATQIGACFYALQVFASSVEEAATASAPAVSPSQFAISSSAHQVSAVTLALSVGVAIVGTAFILLLVSFMLVQRRKSNYALIWSTGGACSSDLSVKEFEYRQIQQATDNFSNFIRKGNVYKGIFKDGLVAEVKKVPTFSSQSDEDFVREVEIFGRLHHRHLVTPRGFCMGKRERFLVYDYLGRVSSLEEHLSGGTKAVLDWRTRMSIALGVASGLEYLHCFCDPPLCHRDINSSNILLDENLVPKVATFCIEGDTQHDSPGHPRDPEYLLTGRYTEKSDVFSYGLLLLELVTGRRTRSLADLEWVHEGQEPETWRLLLLLDPRLDKSAGRAGKDVGNLVRIAKLCTVQRAAARPSMTQVLRLLNSRDSSRPYRLHRLSGGGGGEKDSATVASSIPSSLKLPPDWRLVDKRSSCSGSGSCSGGSGRSSRRSSSPSLSSVTLENDEF